jgi:hypothetical protein
MPNMPRKQTAQVLVADLTWADLYATSIRKDVKMLIPAVKKISTRVALTVSAALLRQQLESAKSTTAELKKMTRLQPGHPDRSGSDR